MGDKTPYHMAGTHRHECKLRAREHEISESKWRSLSTFLTVLSALSGVVAGATLVTSRPAGTPWAFTAGAFALLGAAALAVDAKLECKANAEAHRSAAVGFEDMRSVYATLENNVQGLSIEQARVELKEAYAKTVELAKVSPLVEAGSRKKREREDAKKEEKKALVGA
ncbi:hypothetical protein [Streptomyces sp. NPDC058621]|uniref:hypothetical protein n=1 Tax=Streptomyces sp. NPDC058621 TaxID=3346561 RepID=UPI003646D658